ncbi:hypothetical protein ABL78_5557 [Leptomonas seymouri]|uniref:Uncharacterized protein n=1 Tax=Leptomonas seymouri TaxID=5684 RepID=A0A0N0P4J6_LEPSE|nr:hypothetical protein ABL78_5557 [Leptomonas seymouri]|eukprot:KPI85376.1 hypothetical protein ABL78_5557 [Leptomonas seymouri]
MFAGIYEEEDTTARPFEVAVGESEHVKQPAGPCVLVPDSDNDDSLGLPPPSTASNAATTPVPRVFSKRLAKCAAGLLQQHRNASSTAAREQCMRQLRRLGGAYRPLGQGQTPTVWVCYAQLNARAILETEAYFGGQLSDRVASPHVSRRNGSLSATTKHVVQLSTGAAAHGQPCGVRSPLPSAVPQTAGRDDFALSRGEQLALSLLSMEDGDGVETTHQPMLTCVLRKDAHGELQRVCIPSPAPNPNTGHVISGSPASPHTMTPLHRCWAYDDEENGLSSVHTSPSAAHSTESPGAVSSQRKRCRAAEDTVAAKSVLLRFPGAARRLSFGDDRSCSSSRATERDPEGEVSVKSCSVVPPNSSNPKSLSATVIEHQNHRVQWSLLRQQSLFSPF